MTDSANVLAKLADWTSACAEVERLTALIEAVREVHSAASPEMPYCVGCDAESDVFNTDWPCPTIRILDGAES